MAVNIVSLITQFLTPDMISKIAAALGLDATKTQAAAGAAVPGLLSGLLGSAARPGGPEKLAGAVNEQAGLLDSIGGLFGGGGGSPTSVVDNGSALLGSLLGSGQQQALEGAVGKFAGLGQNAVGSLLGALAPMVLGVIGKQAGPGGFDAGSLVTLLSSQKDNIAKAMPSGLGNLLQGTGILDSLGGLAGAATGAAGAAAGAAGAAADRATRAATTAAAQTGRYAAGAGAAAARSGMNWIYWALPVVLVLGLIWFFMGNRPTTPPVDSVITGSVPNVTVGGIDVVKELGGSLDSVRTSLAGITDATTARAAIPNLEAATAQIDTLTKALGQATTEQKTAIANMARPGINQITDVFAKAMAIPGVGDVLKPVIDTLKSKLATIVA